MSDHLAIRDQWGPQHFECSPGERLASLPLRPQDAAFLRDTGLPTGPENALALSLRWESVKIIHQPRNLRRLVEAGFEKGDHFPKTGQPAIDAWADLTQFVAFGEVPNDFKPGGSFYLSRFACLDGVRGNVWWVYPQPLEGKTECCLFNTSLPGYLACLLAYKEFREEWFKVLGEYPDEDAALNDHGYQTRAERIHKSFLERLAEADPVGFKEGFWECHAWNEAILMGVG